MVRITVESLRSIPFCDAQTCAGALVAFCVATPFGRDFSRKAIPIVIPEFRFMPIATPQHLLKGTTILKPLRQCAIEFGEIDGLLPLPGAVATFEDKHIPARTQIDFAGGLTLRLLVD